MTLTFELVEEVGVEELEFFQLAFATADNFVDQPSLLHHVLAVYVAADRVDVDYVRAPRAFHWKMHELLGLNPGEEKYLDPLWAALC